MVAAIFILAATTLRSCAAFTLPLDVGGESNPLDVNVDLPSTFQQREQYSRALLRDENPGYLRSLPAIFGGDPNSEEHLDGWTHDVTWRVESELVRLELGSLRGDYWDFMGFYHGRGFADEANRLVLQVVGSDTANLAANAIAALRVVVADNENQGRPLAAASQTLAQLLYDHGDGARDKLEAADIMHRSITNLRLPHNFHRGTAVVGTRSVTLDGSDDDGSDDVGSSSSSSSSSSMDGSGGYGSGLSRLAWGEAVRSAQLEVVVAATARTTELSALERSAEALSRSSVTVLGLGTEWPGPGLKLTLLAEHLEQVCSRSSSGGLGDLVLFVDVASANVLPLEPLKHLKERFIAATAVNFRGEGRGDENKDSAESGVNDGENADEADARVLFGAAGDPAPDTSVALLFKRAKSQAVPFPFLHSGFVLGLASDLLSALREVLLDMKVHHAHALSAANPLALDSFSNVNAGRRENEEGGDDGDADDDDKREGQRKGQQGGERGKGGDGGGWLERVARGDYSKAQMEEELLADGLRWLHDVDYQRWFTRLHLRRLLRGDRSIALDSCGILFQQTASTTTTTTTAVGGGGSSDICSSLASSLATETLATTAMAAAAAAATAAAATAATGEL